MILLLISVTTRAAIGPFSGPYFSVQSTKLKAVFVVKMFLDNNVFRKLLLKEQIFSGIVTCLFSIN